jgi:ppGpp synthetase/RelA/SpoT-type nucleotidyltranferase
MQKVQAELARVKAAFEKADEEMQAINASEAKEQEEKKTKEKMA